LRQLGLTATDRVGVGATGFGFQVRQFFSQAFEASAHASAATSFGVLVVFMVRDGWRLSGSRSCLAQRTMRTTGRFEGLTRSLATRAQWTPSNSVRAGRQVTGQPQSRSSVGIVHSTLTLFIGTRKSRGGFITRSVVVAHLGNQYIMR
jgi:hypothetical protein